MLKITYANGDFSLIDMSDPSNLYRVTHALQPTRFRSGYGSAARMLDDLADALKDGATVQHISAEVARAEHPGCVVARAK